MMDAQHIIKELEELEASLRNLAKRNNQKMEAELKDGGSRDKSLLYAGQANAYEWSADLIANEIRLAREW